MTMLTSDLIRIADAYCEATSRSRSRVATLIFNDGKKLDLVAQGSDLNTRSFEKAMAWFSENWPEGIAWPAGVERPGGQERGGAAIGHSSAFSDRPARVTE